MRRALKSGIKQFIQSMVGVLDKTKSVFKAVLFRKKPRPKQGLGFC